MNGTWFQNDQIPSFAACLLGLILTPTASGGQAFDLAPTRGIGQFAGSAAAGESVFKNRRAPGRSGLTSYHSGPGLLSRTCVSNATVSQRP